MTLTHASHLGLEIIGVTKDSVVLAGTLASCKRIAAAHGMEIEKHEGSILSSNCGVATYAPVNESRPNRILYAGGGMIQRGRDDYSIVIPRRVWDELV